MGSRNEGICRDRTRCQGRKGPAALCSFCATVWTRSSPTGSESYAKGRLRYESTEVVEHAKLGTWTAR